MDIFKCRAAADEEGFKNDLLSLAMKTAADPCEENVALLIGSVLQRSKRPACRSSRIKLIKWALLALSHDPQKPEQCVGWVDEGSLFATDGARLHLLHNTTLCSGGYDRKGELRYAQDRTGAPGELGPGRYKHLLPKKEECVFELYPSDFVSHDIRSFGEVWRLGGKVLFNAQHILDAFGPDRSMRSVGLSIIKPFEGLGLVSLDGSREAVVMPLRF